MHIVTTSSLTEETPLPMKETTSSMVTLQRFQVNSKLLCVCVEFRDLIAFARAMNQ